MRHYILIFLKASDILSTFYADPSDETRFGRTIYMLGGRMKEKHWQCPEIFKKSIVFAAAWQVKRFLILLVFVIAELKFSN